MTRNPLKTSFGLRMTEAVDLLAARKISELPVVDAEGRPVGLIDVTDVLGLFPSEELADAVDEEETPPLARWRVVDEPQRGRGA
jgi:arabinose-5-phosphate isomerase